MVKFIIPSMEELTEEFLASVKSYVDSIKNTDLLKCIVFMIVLVLNYLLIWKPYEMNLNNKIWRTKGMLNMIPIEIIVRNP
mmetsp:Transcript_15652/g.2210  ORF Transcript_15652/g.2210 Transcript_15652/m.2210 type:complete len:81 (-) Transcript_15652:113-355(-)